MLILIYCLFLLYEENTWCGNPVQLFLSTDLVTYSFVNCRFFRERDNAFKGLKLFMKKLKVWKPTKFLFD